MKWQLSIRPEYIPDGTFYMGFPGDDIAPYFEFETIDDLVDFVRSIGRLAEGDLFETYADRVKQEGEVMDRVVTGSSDKTATQLWRLVHRAIRRELPPVNNPADVVG